MADGVTFTLSAWHSFIGLLRQSSTARPQVADAVAFFYRFIEARVNGPPHVEGGVALTLVLLAFFHRLIEEGIHGPAPGGWRRIIHFFTLGTFS